MIIDDICVLAMKIITIDRTQRSIRVQTYDRKFQGSLCSLPRKITKVTPNGVKVELAEKFQRNLFILLRYINTNIIDYNRLTFDTREH